MLEVIAKKNAHLTLLKDMGELRDGMTLERDAASRALDAIGDSVGRLASSGETEAQFQAKEVLSSLGSGISTIMLLAMGEKLGSERFLTAGRLYAQRFLDRGPFPVGAMGKAREIFAIDEAS